MDKNTHQSNVAPAPTSSWWLPMVLERTNRHCGSLPIPGSVAVPRRLARCHPRAEAAASGRGGLLPRRALGPHAGLGQLRRGHVVVHRPRVVLLDSLNLIGCVASCDPSSGGGPRRHSPTGGHHIFLRGLFQATHVTGRRAQSSQKEWPAHVKLFMIKFSK